MNVILTDERTCLVNLSHELHTPLHAILGLSQILQSEDLTPRQAHMVHLINQNGDLLFRIVSNLLDIDQIDRSCMTLQFQSAELSALIGDLRARYTQEAATKGLSLSFPCDLSLIPPVMVDRDRLTQVLQNLLSNAIKFTDAGEVTLCARSVSDGAQANLRISITDTGIGLTPSQCKRIFDRFYQVDASTTRVQNGSGLGLAVSREICALMGGKISVESRVGVGSTFEVSLTLPIDQKATSQGESHRRKDRRSSSTSRVRHHDEFPGMNGLVILVADDEKINRRYVSKVLGDGAEVVEVADGVEALRAIEQHTFDLLILDQRMPSIDGLDVIRHVRQKEAATYRLPALCITGETRPEFATDAIAEGFDEVLTKPFTRDQLLTVLERLIKRLEP